MKNDSLANGIVAGICFPIIFFFLIDLGIGVALAYILDNFNGFSLKLTSVLAIVSNIIPVQIFHSQGRGLSMRGVVFTTLILVAIVLIYFRSSFFG